MSVVARSKKHLLCLLIWMALLPVGHPSASSEEPPQRHVSLLATWNADSVKSVAHKLLTRLTTGATFPEIDIVHPVDGAVLPPNMAAPHIFWKDAFLLSKAWMVMIQCGNGACLSCLTNQPRWIPKRASWEWLRKEMGSDSATLRVVGIDFSEDLHPVTHTQIQFSISNDPFDGLLFYKLTLLPFLKAREHPEQSRWMLADIAAYGPPRTVLEGVGTCAHCHTFSPDGRMFGMDLDRNGDKGGYLLAEVSPRMPLGEVQYITWNAYRPGDGDSMGLFTKISPCGRYLASTVKETSFFAMMPNLAYSQLFFPIEGHIAVYDRKRRQFRPLPGADRRDAVQTCPAWSPDGRTIVFARAPVDSALVETMRKKGFIEPDTGATIADLNRSYRIQFDLYTVPFDRGHGGTPIPLQGASRNGRSNFFPRYSPDGRWIVFNQSDTGLVLQPDSALYIVPSQGGKSRRMRCNTGRMNSWHSWSPNGRWVVFASKAVTPYTELLITHVDSVGNDSPPVALNRLNQKGFAAVLPEVIPQTAAKLEEIQIHEALLPPLKE